MATETGTATETNRPTDTASLRTVFTHPDAVLAIKATVAAFAVFGVGTGLSGYALLATVAGGGSVVSYTQAFLGVALVGGVTVTGPVLAGAFALRADPTLAELDDRRRYATLAVAGFVGYVAYAFLATVLISVPSNGDSAVNVGRYLVPFVLGGVGAAVVGAGVVFVRSWLLD